MVFARLFKSNPPPYTAVSKDEVEEDSLLPPHLEEQQQQHAYQRAFRTRIILSHAATFLIAVLFTAAILILSHPTSLLLKPKTEPEPKTKYLHCGNSTAEARAQGCVFDVLTNMWVPEQCWDREGTEEFMRTAPWQGYDYQDGKRMLTLDEMSERVGRDRLGPDPTTPPYWTPLREHVIHCALMWQRQHRGFMRGVGKKLDFHSLSYQHTLHCSKSLVHMAGAGEEAPDPLDKIAIKTWVGFSDCEVEI